MVRVILNEDMTWVELKVSRTNFDETESPYS